MNALREAAQANLRRTYTDGLRDGVLMVLDHLEGRSEADSPEGCYRGPVPDELREWIAGVRARA